VGLGVDVGVGASVGVALGVREGTGVWVGREEMVRSTVWELRASPLSARNRTDPASLRVRVVSARPPAVAAETGRT
jgi:hypothetical protein